MILPAAPTVPTVSTRRTEFLPFSPPLIGDEEIGEVVEALRSGWINTGPRTKRFEADFASYLGAHGAVGLNSWTAALHTCLCSVAVVEVEEVIATLRTYVTWVSV